MQKKSALPLPAFGDKLVSTSCQPSSFRISQSRQDAAHRSTESCSLVFYTPMWQCTRELMQTWGTLHKWLVGRAPAEGRKLSMYCQVTAIQMSDSITELKTYQSDARSCWHEPSKQGMNVVKHQPLNIYIHTAWNKHQVLKAPTYEIATNRQSYRTDIRSGQETIQEFQEEGQNPRFCVLCSKGDLNPAARPLDSAALHRGRSGTPE